MDTKYISFNLLYDIYNYSDWFKKKKKQSADTKPKGDKEEVKGGTGI